MSESGVLRFPHASFRGTQATLELRLNEEVDSFLVAMFGGHDLDNPSPVWSIILTEEAMQPRGSGS